MSFTHESLESKFAIDEFFIHPDNRLESLEAAQNGFNTELKKNITKEDITELKTSLVDLVEETLSAPRGRWFEENSYDHKPDGRRFFNKTFCN